MNLSGALLENQSPGSCELPLGRPGQGGGRLRGEQRAHPQTWSASQALRLNKPHEQVLPLPKDTFPRENTCIARSWRRRCTKSHKLILRLHLQAEEIFTPFTESPPGFPFPLQSTLPGRRGQGRDAEAAAPVSSGSLRPSALLPGSGRSLSATGDARISSHHPPGSCHPPSITSLLPPQGQPGFPDPPASLLGMPGHTRGGGSPNQ